MDRAKALSVFVAVAEESGFAAAGRKVGLSAPSATRIVSELETELGVRLFHRTTRSVHLTAAGERLFADAKRILGDLEEMMLGVAGSNSEPRGPVSVTGSVLFGRLVLTPILFQLMDRYPAISLSILFVDRIVHMVDEGLDVAVRLAHLPDSSLSAIRVGEVRRVMCASPSYLEQYGAPQRSGDLRDHAIIQFSQMLQRESWTFSEDTKPVLFRPEARLLVNNADAAISAAVDGRGLTRVLSYQVADHVAAGRLKLVLVERETAPLPVHVVHKEAGQTSARVRAVVDHMVSGLRLSPLLDH